MKQYEQIYSNFFKFLNKNQNDTFELKIYTSYTAGKYFIFIMQSRSNVSFKFVLWIKHPKYPVYKDFQCEI